MEKEYLKNEQNLLKGSEAKETIGHYLFAYDGNYKLATITKESARFEILSEEKAFTHCQEFPKTAIVLFKLFGAQRSDFVEILDIPEIIEIYSHQIDDVIKFLKYPLTVMNRLISSKEYLTLLSQEEIEVLGNFSHVFK